MKAVQDGPIAKSFNNFLMPTAFAQFNVRTITFCWTNP
jgi:hypothetical protein